MLNVDEALAAKLMLRAQGLAFMRFGACPKTGEKGCLMPSRMQLLTEVSQRSALASTLFPSF